MRNRHISIYSYGHIMPIMDGYLIAYRLPKGIPNRVYTKFQKKFFGQETSSHSGRYRYRRSGLLDDVPHRNLIRGVLVVNEKDMDHVVDFLKEYDAEVHVRIVQLTEEDIKTIGVQII